MCSSDLFDSSCVGFILMVPQMAVQSMDLRWKSPEPGFYKVNFDGALFLD